MLIDRDVIISRVAKVVECSCSDLAQRFAVPKTKDVSVVPFPNELSRSDFPDLEMAIQEDK